MLARVALARTRSLISHLALLSGRLSITGRFGRHWQCAVELLALLLLVARGPTEMLGDAFSTRFGVQPYLSACVILLALALGSVTLQPAEELRTDSKDSFVRNSNACANLSEQWSQQMRQQNGRQRMTQPIFAGERQKCGSIVITYPLVFWPMEISLRDRI